MSKLNLLALVLVIVGGINWGLVAIAKFDLVATLVGLYCAAVRTPLARRALASRA